MKINKLSKYAEKLRKYGIGENVENVENMKM